MGLGDYLNQTLRTIMGSNNGNSGTQDTVGRIRRILDNAGVGHRFIGPQNESDTSDFVFSMDKDEDCCKDIIFVISIDENLMVLRAFMDAYNIEKSKIPDAIVYCNTWNATHSLPQVYVSEDDMIFTSWCNAITTDVSDEYIRDYMILAYAKTSWQFFCEFAKKFI